MLARTDLLEAADSELLALARAGESEAFGILYERHVAAARQLAYHLAATPRQADDVVAETFGQMQDVLARGGGPASAVRLYVLTAVRRVSYERLHGTRGQPPADGATLPDPDQWLVDPAFTGLDTALIARAYQSLSERSRAVLWHTEIEHDDPADLAPLLGLTRNGVVALRRRAMDDLRQAYLQMHIALITQPGCRPVAERLGAFDRRSLTARDAALVSEHLARCEGCQVVHRELADITATVRGVVAPLVLGPAATAYLADAGHHGPVVTTGRTGRTSPGVRPGSGSSELSPAGMGRGNLTAPLAGSELALLPDPDQIGYSSRSHRRSRRGLPRIDLRSRRVAAAVAAGAVAAVIAATTLALALTGNNNAPASAHRLPPAPSRHAASTHPLPSQSLSPSPAASPSPSPSPPAPAVAPIQLTASLSISTHGASRHPDPVVFQVTNSGSTASGPLTAVVALPAGSSLFGGSSSGGDWTCQSTGGGATCTHAPLQAGQQAQGTLFITVTSSGACGQPVRLTVMSGGATAEASQAIPC